MEPVWRGLLTCDYEHARPQATRLEWDIYTASLTAWPDTLMGECAPYGRLRRPGIVDIPEPDHHRLLARWHELLGDPGYVTDLARRTDNWAAALSLALDNANRNRRRADGTVVCGALADATRHLLALNATHIVNWLLPEQPWEDLLTGLLGTPAQARACLFALMTPTDPGHLLDTHAHVLTTARRLRDGADAHQLAATLAATAGPIYGAASPGRTPLPLEDPDNAAALLRRTAAGHPDTEMTVIAEARNAASARRDAWQAAAILAAAGNPHAVRAVRAVALACRWAVNCEERRKELRHHYLAAVRRWCTRTGRDPARITVHDMLTGGTS